MVFFESVHRIGDSLGAMATAFGPDRPAAVCRELTKTHEEVRRGPLAELAAWAAEGLRGEITVVVAGASGAAVEPPAAEQLLAEIAELTGSGKSTRDAVDQVAARYDLNRRTVYGLATARR